MNENINQTADAEDAQGRFEGATQEKKNNFWNDLTSSQVSPTSHLSRLGCQVPNAQSVK